MHVWSVLPDGRYQGSPRDSARRRTFRRATFLDSDSLWRARESALLGARRALNDDPDGAELSRVRAVALIDRVVRAGRDDPARVAGVRILIGALAQTLSALDLPEA